MTLSGKSNIKENHGTSGFRTALPQALAVMVKNVLLIAYGMTIGYPTILIPSLSSQSHDSFHLNTEQISWISSINMMCVPLGCLLSGAVTQPIGRKKAMQIINFPLLGCWLMFRFAKEVRLIYLALGLTGFIGGILEAPVLTYVAEITQPHLRGVLSATSTLSIIIGILFMFLLGTFLDWRTAASVSCALPVTSFCLLLLIPESPYWLVMNKRFEEARRGLAWLRGWTTVELIEAEFQELCVVHQVQDVKEDCIATINGTKNENARKDFNIKETLIFFLRSKVKNAKYFTKKNFLWPLSLVAFLYFLANFTGFATFQTYAVQIFATLRTPINKYYATVFLGVAEFLGCIICVTLVHYTGKRVIAFISITGTGICTTMIATYAYMVGIKDFVVQGGSELHLSLEIDWYNWLGLVFTILLAFVSHCGIRVLPWIIIGEVYSNETRAMGCGISAAISYVLAFLANKIFLNMMSLLTFPGVYWLYASFSFLGVVIIYFTLPETEGKPLKEITDHFSGVSKLDNKIRRKVKSVIQQNGNTNSAFESDVPQTNQSKDVESRL